MRISPVLSATLALLGGLGHGGECCGFAVVQRAGVSAGGELLLGRHCRQRRRRGGRGHCRYRQTIVGDGTHNGFTEAWVATIPEPATALLGIMGVSVLLRRRSRA